MPLTGAASSTRSQPTPYPPGDGYATRAIVCVLMVGFATLAKGLSSFVVAGAVPLADAAVGLMILARGRALAHSLRVSRTTRFLIYLWVLWLLYSSIQLYADISVYGSLAARDWLITLEFGALALGASLATGRTGDQRSDRIFPKLVDVVAAFTLLYPVKDYLGSSFGQPASEVIFNFGNVGVAGAALLVCGSAQVGARKYFWTLSGALGILFSQGRMIYLVVPAVLIALWISQRNSESSQENGRSPGRRIQLSTSVLVLAIGLGLASLIPSTGGRLGEVSAAGIGEQVTSVFSSENAVAGSIDDRRRWWSDIASRIQDDPALLIHGRGYGPDLLSGFTNIDGELVRKPHNDYLETLARVGLIPAGALVIIVGTGLWLAWLRAQGGRSLVYVMLAWLAAAAGTAFAQPYFAYAHGAVPVAVIIGYLSVSGPERE